MIEYIDDTDNRGLDVSQKVEECCNNIEASVKEWKMEAVMADPDVKFSLRCLIADHIMNIYAVIVGLKRLANRVDNTSTLDAMTVRAARKVVRTLLGFEQHGGMEDWETVDPSKFVFVQ